MNNSHMTSWRLKQYTQSLHGSVADFLQFNIFMVFLNVISVAHWFCVFSLSLSPLYLSISPPLSLYLPSLFAGLSLFIVIVFILSDYTLFCQILKHEWMNENLVTRENANNWTERYTCWRREVSFHQWSDTGYANHSTTGFMLRINWPTYNELYSVCVCNAIIWL